MAGTFPANFHEDTIHLQQALAEHNLKSGTSFPLFDLDPASRSAVLARAQELKDKALTILSERTKSGFYRVRIEGQ